jgi:hypothetical protein
MPRLLAILLMLAAPVLSLAACGSADDGTDPVPAEPAAARPADFPPAKGKTVAQLTGKLKEGAVLNPSSFFSQKVGAGNRLGFAIVDRANKQLDVSEVAVYTAKPDGTQLRGPFVARKESLDVETAFRSAQATSDLANGKTFYVARPAYASRGQHVAIGLVRLDGRLVVALPPMPMNIGIKNGPPDVGDKAIRIHTLTPADVGGDLRKLSTRVPPPPGMLDTDFADVLGKKPVVLLFATPQLCSSRICGPVVDIAEQVKAHYGKGVTFIQQEIYKDNKPPTTRPQVDAYHLPSEPWAFVINRHGKITSRFEGVFSTGELARAVAKVK